MKHALRVGLGLVALSAVGSCTAILGDDYEVGPSDGAGGAAGEAGPGLLGSVPAHGEQNASIVPFVTLFFDRAVSPALATGKIRMASDAHPAEEIAQVDTCDDGSPTCLEVVVPLALTVDGKLPGAATFTLVVDRSFADADGHTNAADTVLSFQTFAYAPAFHSFALSGDFAGLAYSPFAGALYAAGTSGLNYSGPTVARLALDAAGAPLLEDVVATPNVFSLGDQSGQSFVAHGVDDFDDRLTVSLAARNLVIAFAILPDGTLDPAFDAVSGTSLDPPDDSLYRPDTVAVLRRPAPAGDLYYFGSGYYGTPTLVTGIIEYRPMAMAPFALWQPKLGLFDAEPGFYLALGTDGVTSETSLYVANRNRVYKLRHAPGQPNDKELLNTGELEASTLHNPGLRTDSQGRLYLGDESGLSVFDTTGFSGFTLLARRSGLDMRRFDLREDGASVHVYYGRFGGPTTIGELVIDF